jgi:hypothetical protein
VLKTLIITKRRRRRKRRERWDLHVFPRKRELEETEEGDKYVQFVSKRCMAKFLQIEPKCK